LSNNELTGPIPTELGRLSALTSFSLGSNRLTKNIPTELGAQSELLILRLGRNRLTGSVPAAICRLGRSRGTAVAVDCGEVRCDCNCTCAEAAEDDWYYGDAADDPA
jgi:hypothetical protein